MKLSLAITRGDPAGIGPEIVAKALKDPRVRRVCEPIVLGATQGVAPGKPSRAGGQSAIAALHKGLALLRAGHVRALVTAPVSKESFSRADYGFPGHTEFLAHAARVKDVGMLMVAGRMRALLMTRHIPLKDVSRHLTPALIVRSSELAYRFLKGHIRKNPRMVLCGINPHAGDNGLIGREEKTVFRSALRLLKPQRRSVSVSGPIASDAAFREMAQGRWDLALAAYHDQGMIPLKVYAGHRLVNITLGLPYIRTSPGHGTAYDIAGKNKADPRPMIEAILLAARYARVRWSGA